MKNVNFKLSKTIIYKLLLEENILEVIQKYNCIVDALNIFFKLANNKIISNRVFLK